MIPFAIADARPDTLALGAGQQDIEIEHALERAGPQIGPVEQHGKRACLFAKLPGIGRDLVAHRAIDCDRDPLRECGLHALMKVSSGPCPTR